MRPEADARGKGRHQGCPGRHLCCTGYAASYSDFLMSKANWKPILVLAEVLNMSYQAILD